MTRRMLADFGVAVSCEEHGAGERLSVSGPLRAPAAALVLEPDASSAAVALAAACLSGGALRVPGLGADSTQGDVRIVAHLAAFGCDARSDAEGLFAQGCPRTGADLDLAGEPDLAPVLAAVAAAAALRAGAPSRLAGLGTLPGKESDRLAVLAEGLEAAGTRVEVGRDWLRIAPARSAVARPVVLDPRGDHRMVFAFALLSLVRPGVLVREPGCVAKSWGSFWSDLERIGARPAAG
jgi:3-phosphoshikimate 1-carboxyvinyltransferase